MERLGNDSGKMSRDEASTTKAYGREEQWKEHSDGRFMVNREFHFGEHVV